MYGDVAIITVNIYDNKNINYLILFNFKVSKFWHTCGTLCYVCTTPILVATYQILKL